MKTYSVKAADIKKSWIVVDAAGQTVGRIATEIARILRGKHKPNFTPHLDCGDAVVVINAEKVVLTGNKMKDKFYHHHSGYMGGIKSIAAKDLLAKHPERIIQSAVKGMIPHTKLGNKIMKHLRVYAGTEHEHTAQNPTPAKPRLAK
jgi:large subunit ribosomal protein L13